jgi:hypothetical protein
MKVLSAAVLFCGVMSVFASAQTVGASLQGTIHDPSGAVLPRTQVEIRNVETGATRSLTADDGGRWREPVLLPGEYEIRASAPGFQTVVRKGIHLAVGQEAVLDLGLEVGQTETEISVIGDAERVNLTSGALSGLVDEKQMRDLPLNGRSFQQLALLQPGVNAVNAGGNDPVGGRTPKISMNGTRPEQSSFLLDGTDINDVYNKTPGSVGGVLLGVEAVLEFQVLTNSYSSEFGRSAGGVINAVTRAGSNQYHGSLFEFLRNSDLDAKNFFDPATLPIPPFKRNQFGGVMGGPIHKDRTFFFGSFESLIDRLGVTGVTSVSNLNARKGLLPTGQINVNQAIQPFLDTLLPPPNGRDLGGGVAQYLFTEPQPTNEYFTQGRIDHRFSTSDSLFGRYTLDNGNVNRPPTVKVPITNTMERSRNQYVTLEYLGLRNPEDSVQSEHLQPGGWAAYFHQSFEFLAGHTEPVRFRHTGRARSGSGLPPAAICLLRTRRHPFAEEPDRQSGVALRVRHGADGGEWEDLQPSPCDRPRDDRRRAMVRQSFAQELCAAGGPGLGPLLEW